jgi:hypothetical protein
VVHLHILIMNMLNNCCMLLMIMWSMKITALEESANFVTLDTEKLFSELKYHELPHKGHPNHDASFSSKVFITSAHVSGHDVNPTNITVSSVLEFALSSLAAASDEQYESIPNNEIALLTRKFCALHKFHKERRRTPRGYFECGDTTHFIADCPKRKKLDSSNKYNYTNYHKEEEALKPTKTHYPSNTKSSFKPKRDVKKETPKPKEEAFVCMFCGRAGHLDEFCFRRKRIEKMHFDNARNSYCDEFSDFPPHFFLALRLALLLVLCLVSLMNLIIAHMVLVHERTTLCLDALGMVHVLIVVIIFYIGLVSQLEGLTLTLSQDTWTVHVFPVVVHVPLGQMVRCKGL